MAGRKQHYLQQHLSKGFAIDPSRDPAQVFVYKRDREPYINSTKDFGAQRDFYSGAADRTLDDMITTEEGNRFDAFIINMRAAPDGGEISPVEAARFYQHLIFRSRSIREVFSSATSELLRGISVEVLQKDKLGRFFGELVARHRDQMVTMVEQQAPRPLTPEEKQLARDFLEHEFPRRIPEMMNDIWPMLGMLLAAFASQIPALVSAGHKDALSKNLLDDSGKREQGMRLMTWRVWDVDDALVLGDSAAIAEIQDGSFCLMSDATMTVANLFVPISTHRYLVGNNSGLHPDIGAERLNRASISCAYESFCSSVDAAHFRNWRCELATRVMPVSSDELHSIAAKCIEKVFSEKLVQGFIP